LNIWNNFENFLINSYYLNSSLLVGPVFISECWPLILRKTILRFFKYWSSSHGFNKLVIKSKIWFLYKKIHAKIFFNFCVYKKMLNHTKYFFFTPKYNFYFLRDLTICTPNKNHFLYYFEMRKVFRNFGNLWGFDEKRVF